MNVSYAPSCDQINNLFQEVALSRGGILQNQYITENILIARAHSLEGLADEVTPGDRMDGGIAIRVSGPQISVHSFTMREVCDNGAIAATTHLNKRMLRVNDEEFNAGSKLMCLSELREMLIVCSSREAFSQNIRQMRKMSNTQIDTAINISSLLQDVLKDFGDELIESVLKEFFSQEDMSLYGVMNAITAVARETKDPQEKWDLEELGGGIGAKLLPIVDPDSNVARNTRPAEPQKEMLVATGDARNTI